MFAEAMPGKRNIRNSDNKDKNEFLKVYASLYFLLLLLRVKTHPSVVRGNGKPSKAHQPVVGPVCPQGVNSRRQCSSLARHRKYSGLQGEYQALMSVRHHATFEFTIFVFINIRPCYIPFDDVLSLQC